MNLKYQDDYMVVPVGVCEYAIQNKMIRALHILMVLKCISSGTIIVDASLKRKIASKLSVTTRLIELQIDKLKEHNWIGVKGKTYFLRSFKTLIELTSCSSHSGVIMVRKELYTFKSFMLGAVIGYQVNMLRRSKRKNRDWSKGSYKIGNDKSTLPQSHLYIPFANSLVAAHLECSMSTASIRKRDLKEKGYIDVKKSFRVHNHIRYQDYNLYKKYSDDSKYTYRSNGEIIQPLPDLLKSNMRFKMRKK